MTFDELLTKANRLEAIRGMTIFGIDPGETSGITIMRDGVILEAFQLKTSNVTSTAHPIHVLMQKYHPAYIAMEEYRVYAWKVKEHANSDMHTSRLIGAIEYMAYVEELKVKKQSAQVAKGFCTDAKLREWGFWQEGMRHARDAIRHAAYFSVFGGLT